MFVLHPPNGVFHACGGTNAAQHFPVATMCARCAHQPAMPARPAPPLAPSGARIRAHMAAPGQFHATPGRGLNPPTLVRVLRARQPQASSAPRPWEDDCRIANSEFYFSPGELCKGRESGQRTECATIVAQCKRPQGRAALGKSSPRYSRP